MGRPPGVVGRAQLKPDELFRVQVLYNDAKMGPTEIARVTGYSINQIKYAIKKKTPTVGKRTGRPPKKGQEPSDGWQAQAEAPAQAVHGETASPMEVEGTPSMSVGTSSSMDVESRVDTSQVGGERAQPQEDQTVEERVQQLAGPTSPAQVSTSN
ncbi:hypothetical protein VTK26DRAFT_9450 [Humicola hyalothermophila]